MKAKTKQLPYPAIYCHLCGKLLRNVQGKELAEIHTNSDGEDVCEVCCDICRNDDSHDDWSVMQPVPDGEVATI